ncbi:MAG: DNA primase, partial [Anaerolineae bacterium]
MFPDELKARSQWICWRSEKRRGKVTKVPYIPGTIRCARSNDPSTWRTFEEAMASCRRGGFDGVSYAFSADDGFTGIDLDHSVSDCGILEPWALQIVQELNSYAEWSPSGHGVHIIIEAELPPRGRKRGDVEMYD